MIVTKIINYKHFCEFYWKLKDINHFANRHGFGNGISLPSTFTEKLCRKIYSLQEIEGTCFDATDDQGNNIEIKATISKYGTTSMSKEKFDYLYWMYFDLEQDLINIYKTSWSDFIKSSSYKKNFSSPSKRVDVRLNQYLGGRQLIGVFKFKKIYHDN